MVTTNPYKGENKGLLCADNRSNVAVGLTKRCFDGGNADIVRK